MVRGPVAEPAPAPRPPAERDATTRHHGPPRRLAAARTWIARRPWAAVWVAVAALTVLAFQLRWRGLAGPLWIDEGISTGIASHPLTEIPGLLRQDGSPPLYYLLLHVWIQLFGTSEFHLHAMSVGFALLAVPAAAWAVARTFGPLASCLAAALVAVLPYVGLYADEVRMYSLVLLLALLTTGAFLRAYVERDRRWIPGFGVALVLVLYSHNWGLFFAMAVALAFLVLLAVTPDRRRLLLEGAAGFGLTAVLFAPWLPTLAFQSAHTGAPWSHEPSWKSLSRGTTYILGGSLPDAVLLLVVGAGLAQLAVSGTARQRRAAAATLVLAAGTLLIAYAWSRLASPAWAQRYLVVVLAPLIVLIAAGLSRTRGLGVAAVVVCFLFAWQGKPTLGVLGSKSNVRDLATAVGPRLPHGTLVFSPQPEQVPNLVYSFPAGMQWLTPLGTPPDASVMDWRDAMGKLDAARYDTVLRPAVAGLAPGTRLLLVQAMFKHPTAPWTRRIRVIARQWRNALGREPTLQLIRYLRPVGSSTRSKVSGWLYVKRARPLSSSSARRASVTIETVGVVRRTHGHRRGRHRP
jgi:mannosyltransferase